MKPLTFWNVTVRSLRLNASLSPSIPTSSHANHFNKPHTDPSPPSSSAHLWLWAIRNSTQDPLTPISSPGGSLPPSLGQGSPSCPPVMLSPGHMAGRWDQAWIPPPCMGEQGLLLPGRQLLFRASYTPSVFVTFSTLGDSSRLSLISCSSTKIVEMLR